MDPKLPKKFILSIKPEEYLKQGVSHCGVYSLKAILSAFGKDNKTIPQDYHLDWLRRKSLSFTFGKHYYDKIFESNGVRAETTTAKNVSDSEKLNFLKEHIAKNIPIMIRIGNGYTFSNRYSPFWGRIILHWITLWGYDDKKQEFYAYDSALPRKYWEVNKLPTGNTKRKFHEILRDWKFGKWNPLAWSTWREDYVYIKVQNKN